MLKQSAQSFLAGAARLCGAAKQISECSTSYSCQAVRFSSGYSKIAETEKGKTKFSGFYSGGFYINNVKVPGSVMAYTDMYMLWRPRTMKEVTPASLVFLDIIRPSPELLVLGCGVTPDPLPEDVAQYLKSRGVQVEVLDSRNATGLFNVCNDEGRVVVGALLALDPTEAMPEVMPEIKDPLWDRPFLTPKRSII